MSSDDTARPARPPHAEPSVGHPRSLRQVDADDGVDHHRGDGRPSERCQQPEREEAASAHLPEAAKSCSETAGTEPDRFEELARAFEAVSAEPSEELLR